MCLLRDKADQQCEHPTCIRSNDDPEFFNNTKSAVYYKQSDFNKVLLRRNPESGDSPYLLEPRNPHHPRSGNWSSFDDFKETCTFRVAGQWPDSSLLSKFDIDFEYYLFARRVEVYDPLTEIYSTEIVLDVEEAAVFKPN